MKWYEELLIILAIFIAITIILLGIKILRYKKLNDNIEKVIKENYPDVKIVKHVAQMIYQLEFKTDKLYLIKIIDINPKNEIIITNSEKVAINVDIRGWRRSSKPNFVAGIKEFIKKKSNIETVKIVLIYPNCHNITKYINESDAFKVNSTKEIDGLFFVKYTELGEFLKKH